MPQPVGRQLSLSLGRRFMADLMRLSERVPLIPIERRMHLGAVASARIAAHPRPSWCAVFVKAYALVAARRVELRRSYFSFPWPHLYEHPVSIASVAVERAVDGEPAVLFGHIRTPDLQSLAEIDRHLRRLKEEPIERISLYRRILKVSRLPGLVRRLLWWYGYNSSGPRRAQYMGTFGVSVVAGLGSSLLALRSPVTTTLSYGVLEADGSLDVRLNFDHRVLDGGNAARALDELERVLCGEILAELRGMSERAVA